MPTDTLLGLAHPVLPVTGSTRAYELSVFCNRLRLSETPTLKTPWPAPRRTLVTTDRTHAYRLGLRMIGANPVMTWTDVPVSQGGFEDLYVFDQRGREWYLNLVQGATGAAPHLHALAHEWDRAGAPIFDFPSPTVRGVTLGVNEGGTVELTDREGNVRRRGRLLSMDGTTAWELRVTADQILQVVELARLERRVYLRANTSSNVYQVTVTDADPTNPLIVLSGPVSVLPTAPWPTLLGAGDSPPQLYQLQVDDTDLANPLVLLTSVPTAAEWTDPALTPDHALYLRSATSGVRYQLYVEGRDPDPLLKVRTDDLAPEVPTALATARDIGIETASGLRYDLAVDQNGLLYLESVTDLINARDEWPVLMAMFGNLCYVVDDRFPPPFPAKTSHRYGMRRRIPRS